MKINLPWTAAIAELGFMRSSVETETAEMTEIVEITVMILISEKWLFEVILDLAGTALAAAII